MNDLCVFQNITMTLKEITDLLCVNHSKAMLKVKSMSESPEFGTVAKIATVYNKQGQTVETYQLDKRQSIAVASRLNTDLLMRVIDRWQELELKQNKMPTHIEALRLYADTLEALDTANLKIEQDKPKVLFAEAVRSMDGSCLLGEYSKTLGIGRNTLFKMLRKDDVLMAGNLPKQPYLDRGLFVVKEGIPYTDREGKTHPLFTTYLTGKGQVWLEKKYRKAA